MGVYYHIDCFAFMWSGLKPYKGTCAALSEIECRNCKFYKTREQQEKELEKIRRLKELKRDREWREKKRNEQLGTK